jgi:hypothetical protein
VWGKVEAYIKHKTKQLKQKSPRRARSSASLKNHSETYKTGKLNKKYRLKGSVQRKLRWVENVVNRSVGASDCGAGHSFVDLFRFHFDFTKFPFPVSTGEFIGKFWTNKRSAMSDVAPNVLALHTICYWRYVDPCA